MSTWSGPYGQFMKQATSSVTEAVRKLRIALGESQQQFAYRMGAAIRTIARWETTRPPKGKTLVQLASIAAQAGFEREADFFRKQLRRELGERAVTGFLGGTLPDTDLERLAVGALLHAMRSPRHQGLVRSTIAGLDEPAGEYLSRRLPKGQTLDFKAIRRLLQNGKQPDEIADEMQVSSSGIRAAVAWIRCPADNQADVAGATDLTIPQNEE
jgi:transcriptional regulator with XRE-family HTH domain